MKPILSLGLFLLGQLVSRSGVAASSIPPEGEEWRYQLLHESTYVDDCPPCGRPTFLQPLRGSFWITPGHSDPLFTRYELRQVAFTVGGVGPDSIRLEGSGELEVGGEVALTHRMTLHLKVTAPGRTEDVAFDSGLQIGEPNWLWLAVSLTEVEPRPFRVLTLTLDAMPIRDLWFSTAHGFTAALLGPKPIPVSAAEVLSDQGRVVVPLAQIEEALHLERQEPPINLDALTVAPGGGVEFSLQVDAPSSSLTTVHHGDLVSLAGQRVKSLVDFASVIGPEPPVTDLGLDAVEHLDDGTFVFSTRESVFSQVLGDTVSRGDVMATSGHRVRTQRELLQAFKPLHPERDYGLDALVVWPSGEIWFSTEESVELEGFAMLSDGDLLSDRGRVIFRNLELLQRFGPLEDAANFGLDALVIATDVRAANKPPRLVTIRISDTGNEVQLGWEGTGRFFQVEQSFILEGPFVSAGPIVAATNGVVPLSGGAAYFRVRQW